MTARHASRAEIKTWTPEQVRRASRAGELDHLVRPESVTAKDLDDWTGEDVAAARHEGRLRHLGLEPKPGELRPGAHLARGDLKSMSPTAIVERHRRGELDPILRGHDLIYENGSDR